MHTPPHPSSALRPPITPFPPVKNSSVCSVCSVGQPSALRPPASAFPSSIRFLRLLRFFAANPPLSVLSRPPSVFRRQPSHPILAPFAPLCGQSPSTRFPPVSSDQTPFQTHRRAAPAARSSWSQRPRGHIQIPASPDAARREKFWVCWT